VHNCVVPFTSHGKLRKFGAEKPISWAKPAHFDFFAINFTVWSNILSTVGDALRVVAAVLSMWPSKIKMDEKSLIMTFLLSEMVLDQCWAVLSPQPFFENHQFWFFPTPDRIDLVSFFLNFFLRIDQGILFYIFLIKLVLRESSSHKCDNDQFSFLVFTIQISNLYSFKKISVKLFEKIKTELCKEWWKCYIIFLY
jgi:hypothetical protein